MIFLKVRDFNFKKTKMNLKNFEFLDKFITDLEKLSNKYGGTMFYDFKKDQGSDAPSFHVQGTHGVSSVLHRMVLTNHLRRVLETAHRMLPGCTTQGRTRRPSPASGSARTCSLGPARGQ